VPAALRRCARRAHRAAAGAGRYGAAAQGIPVTRPTRAGARDAHRGSLGHGEHRNRGLATRRLQRPQRTSTRGRSCRPAPTTKSECPFDSGRPLQHPRGGGDTAVGRPSLEKIAVTGMFHLAPETACRTGVRTPTATIRERRYGAVTPRLRILEGFVALDLPQTPSGAVGRFPEGTREPGAAWSSPGLRRAVCETRPLTATFCRENPFLARGSRGGTSPRPPRQRHRGPWVLPDMGLQRSEPADEVADLPLGALDAARIPDAPDRWAGRARCRRP